MEPNLTYNQMYYRKNKEKLSAKFKQRLDNMEPSEKKEMYSKKNKKANDRKKEFVDRAGDKCWDCNKTVPLYGYDFHHVDEGTKSFELSGANWSRKKHIVEAEVAKCVLLCAICHRGRHVNEEYSH